jgi:hypothetical protein
MLVFLFYIIIIIIIVNKTLQYKASIFCYNISEMHFEVTGGDDLLHNYTEPPHGTELTTLMSTRVSCQSRIKFCPTPFVHVLYGVAWLGFETDVRLHPAETRIYIQSTKYIIVEGAVITGHDASSLGNGSGLE